MVKHRFNHFLRAGIDYFPILGVCQWPRFSCSHHHDRLALTPESSTCPTLLKQANNNGKQKQRGEKKKEEEGARWPLLLLLYKLYLNSPLGATLPTIAVKRCLNVVYFPVVRFIGEAVQYVRVQSRLTRGKRASERAKRTNFCSVAFVTAPPSRLAVGKKEWPFFAEQLPFF
jgi:hypothetical protein